MKTQIFALYDLQKIDSDIFEIEKRLNELPTKILKAEEQIGSFIQEKDSKQEKKEKTLQEKKNREEDIENEGKKIQTVESRLPHIKNPKDYQDIRKKIDQAKKANKVREEEVLKIMESIEKIDEELKTFFPEIDAEIKKLDDAKKIFSEEIEQIKLKKEDLIKSRDQFLDKIDANILKKYEFIRSKSHGVGISRAKNEACEGCFMNLPPQLYNMIIKGDKLYNCPFCQRYLVYIPETEPKEEKQEKEKK